MVKTHKEGKQIKMWIQICRFTLSDIFSFNFNIKISRCDHADDDQLGNYPKTKDKEYLQLNNKQTPNSEYTSFLSFSKYSMYILSSKLWNQYRYKWYKSFVTFS